MATKSVTVASKKEWALAFAALEDINFGGDDESRHAAAEDIAEALVVIRRTISKRFQSQLVEHYSDGNLEVGNTEGIAGRGFGETEGEETVLDLAEIHKKIEASGDLTDPDQRRVFIAATLVHEFVHVAQAGAVTLSKEAKAWAVTQWFLRRAGGLSYLTDHASDVFSETGGFDTQARAEYYVNAAIIESLQDKFFMLDWPNSEANKGFPSYSATLRGMDSQREVINQLYRFILDREGKAFENATLANIVSEIEENILEVPSANVMEWGNVVSRTQVQGILEKKKGQKIIPRD